MENKKILSFDVGIKNLAYCIILKENQDSFKILKWGIINLIDEINVNKCMFKIKGGQLCNKNANYNIYEKTGEKIFDDNNNFFCCENHKKKSMPKIIKLNKEKNKISKKKSKNNNKQESLMPLCMYCDYEAEYVINTNTYCGYCEMHYIKYNKKSQKNIGCKKLTVINCDDFPLFDLSKILFEKFDLFPDFLNVDEVLIENQPGRLNNKIKVGNKIKTVASFIYSYFIIRGVIEKDKTKSTINKVDFVSASNKLKINEKTTNKILDVKNKDKEKDSRQIYNLTKNLGKEYCLSLICNEDKEILNKNKKKDDMCDAFLQGFQYLFNPVPEKFVKMLKNVDLTFQNKNNKK